MTGCCNSGDLSADGRPVIVAAHPHGVVGIAVLGNLMAENGFFPPTMDYRVLTVSLNFMVPYLRDLFLSLGFVEATPESIRYCLRHNTSVVNVVGGAEEALDSRPGSLDLTLASRSGFIRMAMEVGCACPCGRTSCLTYLQSVRHLDRSHAFVRVGILTAVLLE